MSTASKNSIIIEASATAAQELLFNPSTYSSWSTVIPAAKVLATDESGRAIKVEATIKAGPVKDRVTLDYVWGENRNQLRFVLDEADMLTEMEGVYSIADNGDETITVTYELHVALSMPVPEMMRTKAERETIDKVLNELKNKLEG